MPAQDPRLAGQGTIGDSGPPYILYSVSPKVDQDAEYWVLYDTELIQPGTTLIADGSQTFAQIMARNRMDGPIAQKLAPYVLVDVQTEGGKNWLVFARATLPSVAYYNNPSLQFPVRKTWEFPAIMRSFPFAAPGFQADIQNGNLINVIANPDIVPRYVGPCIIIVSQWWTVVPWSQTDLLRQAAMVPSVVSWDYKGLASGSISCLHGPIQTPPISGIIAIRGLSVPPTTVPGIQFFETNVASWTPDVEDDDQKPIRGRFFREQRLVQIPFDPSIYPQSPMQFTS